MAKILPDNAGDTGSDPWSRKIPHATGPVSPCATTTDAHTPMPDIEPMPPNKRSYHSEKPTTQLE